MSENATVLPDQPVVQLTASQLEALITAVVRRVMREELHRDYYVDEHGIKVLYAAEEAAPSYLAELQKDYEAIQRDEVELTSSEGVAQELRDLGLDVRIIVDDIAQHDAALRPDQQTVARFLVPDESEEPVCPKSTSPQRRVGRGWAG